MEIKGIDVSKWQGKIDFEKVKKSGVDFVIIKAGGSDSGFYTDKYFETNYKNAKNAGLKVGCYYIPGKYFVGVNNGLADAKKFLEIIKGKQFDYPVYLDIELQNSAYISGITEASIAFCDYMEKKGYFIGIYGSEYSTFESLLYKKRVERFSFWVANYSKKPALKCAMWQYTSKGKVNGITGNVDMNISYQDFDKIIKQKGLNGYVKNK